MDITYFQIEFLLADKMSNGYIFVFVQNKAYENALWGVEFMYIKFKWLIHANTTMKFLCKHIMEQGFFWSK
jgi:hypothetical protein